MVEGPLRRDVCIPSLRFRLITETQHIQTPTFSCSSCLNLQELCVQVTLGAAAVASWGLNKQQPTTNKKTARHNNSVATNHAPCSAIPSSIQNQQHMTKQSWC